MQIRLAVAGLGLVLILIAPTGCGRGGAEPTLAATRHTGVIVPPAAHVDVASARTACDRRGRDVAGMTATLRAAFDSTVSDVRGWQETRNGPNGPNAVADFVALQQPDASMVICYFDDGDGWAFPTGAPPSGRSRPLYNRIRVLATTSASALDAAGYHDTPGYGPGNGELALERPASATAIDGDACPSPDEVQQRINAQPRRIEVTERQTLGYGLRLDPPPPEAAAELDAHTAYRRAARAWAGDPGPHPTIALGLFSNDHGDIRMNADGTETKLIQDRLAWVVVFGDTTVGMASGGAAADTTATVPPPPPCNLGTAVVPVDAGDGTVLSVYSEGRPGH